MRQVMFLIMLMFSSLYASFHPQVTKLVEYNSNFSGAGAYIHQQYGHKAGRFYAYDGCVNYLDYRAYYKFNLGTMAPGYRIKTMRLYVTRSYPSQPNCNNSTQSVTVTNPGNITSTSASIIHSRIGNGSFVGTLSGSYLNILHSYSDQGGIVNIGVLGSSTKKQFDVAANGVYIYVETELIAVPDITPPSVPQGLVTSWVNGPQEGGNPRIDWNANTESDLSHYEIWKKIDNWFDADVNWFIKSITIHNYYIDLSEERWNTFGPPSKVYYKLKVADENYNKSSFSSSVMVYCDLNMNKKALEDKLFSEEPPSYELKSNYPNPFNPITHISYQIQEAGFVDLVVYNALGQKVADLVNQHQSVGSYSVKFDATNLPSGIYVYKLQVNEFSSTKKMLLMK